MLLSIFLQMLFELLNMKSITENILFDKTNFMIDKLMKYCSMENSNEKSKAYVMEQLCQKLSYKKFKKQYSPLFIVKEVNILLYSVFSRKKQITQCNTVNHFIYLTLANDKDVMIHYVTLCYLRLLMEKIYI